jgi:tetratricopeptide (TPR) repeat protein
MKVTLSLKLFITIAQNFKLLFVFHSLFSIFALNSIINTTMSLEKNQSNSPEYYLAQAQTANKKNDIISIIAMTSKCIALCEQNTDQMQEEKNTLTTAYILRANTLLKMGDTAGAEKDLNQLLAITNNKETEDILMLQGRILARKDNHKEAIEYFSKIIANNSSAIEALRERGASYLATGDRIKATEDAERIMTLSPDKVKAVSGDFKGEGTD